MAIRRLWWCLACWCVGSGALLALEPPPGAGAAVLLWQKGQDAMRRGLAAEAVALYEQSLALDPNLTRNHLSLAAAWMEQGNEGRACAHLGRYVRANPDELGVRIHLADLHMQLANWLEAQAEFERCIAFAQDSAVAADGELLHCHARLMEIAEIIEDEYLEHLHRGIGLCLLARQRAILPEAECDLSTESLLCKAAGELTLAHADRPDAARPCWYLFLIWTMLDQSQAALRSLARAADVAPFSGDLTPRESCNLQLQRHCRRVDKKAK